MTRRRVTHRQRYDKCLALIITNGNFLAFFCCYFSICPSWIRIQEWMRLHADPYPQQKCEGSRSRLEIALNKTFVSSWFCGSAPTWRSAAGHLVQPIRAIPSGHQVTVRFSLKSVRVRFESDLSELFIHSWIFSINFCGISVRKLWRVCRRILIKFRLFLWYYVNWSNIR